MKKALITGITGQDGAYLASFLLKNNYQVFGSYRRTSSENFWRIEDLGIESHPHLELVEMDLTDMGNIIRIISKYEFDEIYNLAAQSFVGVSFEKPTTTGLITGLGVTNLLEGIRIVNDRIKFYQASTSEMFGKVQEIPQKETTPFYPRSPYGVAKLYGHWITVNYRESFNIFGSSGILFNHESPLRGKEFVTRKITNSVARIHLKQQKNIELGNLDAKRDWGYAEEYVKGMHKMLQIDEPDTFVLSTGRAETVRDFVEMSFKCTGVQIEWRGKNENEVGIDVSDGAILVSINPKFYRPSEVELLIGDSSKALDKLNWKAETSLEELSRIMVEKDLERNKHGKSY
jgi:GDPmannose 4,6-dehydratase